MHLPAGSRRVNNFNNIMNMKMEDVRYESPQIEILRMEVAQTILSASFTGEGINEWEEM